MKLDVSDVVSIGCDIAEGSMEKIVLGESLIIARIPLPVQLHVR